MKGNEDVLAAVLFILKFEVMTMDVAVAPQNCE